jgi:hypothetical protein
LAPPGGCCICLFIQPFFFFSPQTSSSFWVWCVCIEKTSCCCYDDRTYNCRPSWLKCYRPAGWGTSGPSVPPLYIVALQLIVNRVNDSGNSLFIKNQEKACTRVEWVCDVCVSILAGKQLIDLLPFSLWHTHTVARFLYYFCKSKTHLGAGGNRSQNPPGWRARRNLNATLRT